MIWTEPDAITGVGFDLVEPDLAALDSVHAAGMVFYMCPTYDNFPIAPQGDACLAAFQDDFVLCGQVDPLAIDIGFDHKRGRVLRSRCGRFWCEFGCLWGYVQQLPLRACLRPHGEVTIAMEGSSWLPLSKG